MRTVMNKTDFMALSDDAIAAIIEQRGGRVCNFPLNGTRRWFHLEHVIPQSPDVMQQYMDIAGQAHIDVFSIVFRHGVRTLLSPTFGIDIMQRDEAYINMAVVGMKRLVQHPDFLKFYDEYDVRVRFYGDYHRHFANTPFEAVCALFDELTEQTRTNTTNRLFWGICAHDAVEPVAQLTVDYYREHGTTPARADLIRMYYGEAVAPVDFFIGFDKFAAYDMPLLTTGNEDLYFTVAPSLYMSSTQFREILYDHLFLRHCEETDYSDVSVAGWEAMHKFYRGNLLNTQGVGRLHPIADFWHPVPQVVFPE